MNHFITLMQNEEGLFFLFFFAVFILLLILGTMAYEYFEKRAASKPRPMATPNRR